MSREPGRFLELLKPNYNDALKYCRALCSRLSPDDAEDVLQQSLLLALENFNSLKDESKFRSWFFKIITRAYYTSVRKHFWKKFLPLEEYKYVAKMPEVFERVEKNENKQILYNALSKLTSKERSAILLHEIANFSVEEITAIQNERSMSAVKSRLSRTRKKLRKYIDEFEKQRIPHNSNFKARKGSFEGDLEHETYKIIADSENRQ